MLRLKLIKQLLLAFGMAVLLTALTIGFIRSPLNDSADLEAPATDLESPSVDTVGMLMHDVVTPPLWHFLEHDAWEPLPNGNSQLSVIENSLLVCEGTVVDAIGELRGYDGSEGERSLWFTINKVQINKILAMTPEESKNVFARSQALNPESALGVSDEAARQELTINVVQVGALANSGYRFNVMEDAPLLKKGKTYTLFLSAFDDGNYVPVGGRFGVARNECGILHFTNAQAEKMMILFEGKAKDAAATAIASLKQDFPMDIEVNNSNISALDFISSMQD
ncbi:MAG: hypothetical protein LBL49_10615 [Clostridiales Family XIII bacterium]|jgi:hypothetical protein|nr:hypothetical protein [Clostridiales Family XIII bacterium]